MSAIKPDHALLQLPREIRDEIYSHCYDKTYLVFWSYYDHHDYDEHTLVDLAVLRLSKTISSEAKDILFSKAASKATTFKYDIEFDPHEIFSTPPTKQATERMLNVEFSVYINFVCMAERARDDGYQDETLYPAFSMDPLCEATVDRFACTDIIRDSFRITFNTMFRDFEDEFPTFIKTRFFQTLKRFSTFQKLTIVLDLQINLWDTWKPWPQEVIQKVQMELEPHLGPSVIKRKIYLLSEVDQDRQDVILELEFQPLEFHVESLRGEATRLMMEADRLEGRDLWVKAENDL